MHAMDDRRGVEWPNLADLSADGLRFSAFPEGAEAEFSAFRSKENLTAPLAHDP